MPTPLPQAISDPRAIPFGRDELDGSVVARLARVVAARAADVAISGGGRSLTYAEVGTRTDAMAGAIRSRTTPGPGCVAYLTDHSPGMVLCALAVLKAAKAYLCVHPGLPPAGQRDVVRGAAPDLVLADAAHATAARALAADAGCGFVLLDDVGDASPGTAPIPEPRPTDPAAVFYTSGSTGRPKGVVKGHRALLHRAWLCAQYDGVGPGDRQSLLTFCSFASSEADVFGALLNGAAVELFDVGARGLTEFGAWIDGRGVTLLHPPVAYFRRYLSTLDEGERHHPSVRLVALAGDAVLPADVDRWRRRFAPSCALRHRFSSTEAGHVAVACVGPGEDVPAGTLPPVRAVRDKHLSAVDEAGRPVPLGEPGELVVRSQFLADGYWGCNASATAHAFADDPAHPGHRTFRTGDRVRFLGDGCFEFLGRRDEQVKVRGYRVELREVEHACLALPGVKEAAVIVERREGEARLTAFLAMRDGAAFDAAASRAALRETLPEWKVPARFHATEALPFTLTGKVDRQRLAQLAASSSPTPDIHPEVATTSDPIVSRLTDLWEAALARPGIRPHDDFFDLGGNSLLAAALAQRVERAFGRRLAPADVFRSPTVARMADLLGATTSPADPAAGVLALAPGAGDAPLFCIPSVAGSAISYLPLARLLGGDCPVLALELPPAPGNASVVETVERIAADLVARLRRHTPRGPYRLCGHSFGATLAYEMAQQLHAAGERVDLLAMLDGRAPGWRKQLPLWRRLPLHLRRLARRGNAAVARADRQGAREPDPSTDAAPDARRHVFRAYQPRPYPGVITLLRAEAQPDWAAFLVPQPLNGWDAYCGRVELHPVPGDHLSMLHEPNIRTLAVVLNACLGRA